MANTHLTALAEAVGVLTPTNPIRPRQTRRPHHNAHTIAQTIAATIGLTLILTTTAWSIATLMVQP